MNNTTTKQKWKLPLPVLLTYLIVVTLVATGVSLSAYVTTADGMDAARVAKFEININGENNEEILKQNFTAQIKPGGNIGKFEIVNNSEVAVDYVVTVDSKTNNLPIEVALDKNSGTLEAGGSTANSANGNVSIYWPETENSIEYAGKVELIEITVTATQID